ncbi:hypothetical protein N665_0172s0094 [Sinapis alba]|nr:hypothetical protein N665_0172s0094 [Sinapis alba]
MNVKSGGELMGVDMVLRDAKALFYNAQTKPLSGVKVVEKIAKLGTVTLGTHTNMFSNPASTTQNLTVQPDFPSSRGKNRQYVEKFAALIPRIVKGVGPPESKKQLLLSPYSIIDVPMQTRLNKSCCDCGAYALKYLECHILGLGLSLVDDEIIQDCRQKIAVDLWGAAHDPILAQVMTRYVPSPWERSEVFDLEED